MNILIGLIMAILNFVIAYGGVMLWDKIQSEADSQAEEISDFIPQENLSTPSFAKENVPAFNNASPAPELNAEIQEKPVVETPKQAVVAPSTPLVESTPTLEPVLVEPAVVSAPEPTQVAPAQKQAPSVQDSANKMFNDGSNNSNSNTDKYKNMEIQHSNMLDNIDRLMQ